MVRQVKKYMLVLAAVLIFITASCGTISAAAYSVYEGNLSSSQLQYFRDILPSTNLLHNYVVFRNGQYEYIMIVGDLELNNNTFTLNDSGKIYTINTSSGYNSVYTYNASMIDSFTLSTNDYIVYSDLGDFPQLEDRGQKYEILTTIILCIAGCCYIIRNIFYHRKR